ncbi:MAG: hypothetical protein P8M20_09315 [Planctomycetaceae bacterium]|nr:hypothetical protein [Planctomycetaceae bacterium]
MTVTIVLAIGSGLNLGDTGEHCGGNLCHSIPSKNAWCPVTSTSGKSSSLAAAERSTLLKPAQRNDPRTMLCEIGQSCLDHDIVDEDAYGRKLASD